MPITQRIGLFKELKRRNVFKVAIAYLISAWLMAQVADFVLDNFGAPDWTMRVLLFVLAIGFPMALVVSWLSAGEVNARCFTLWARARDDQWHNGNIRTAATMACF